MPGSLPDQNLTDPDRFIPPFWSAIIERFRSSGAAATAAMSVASRISEACSAIFIFIFIYYYFNVFYYYILLVCFKCGFDHISQGPSQRTSISRHNRSRFAKVRFLHLP
jgi:hypothetical protein